MNRNVPPQELRLITTLTGLAVFAMAGVIVQTSRRNEATAGAGQDRSTIAPRERSTTDPGSNALARWMREARRADYSVIERRPLFGGASTEMRSASTDPPAPTVAAVASSKVEQPTTSVAVHDPEHDRIAVVGVVRLHNETFAIVENVASGETKFVPIGGDAFGYRVKSVSDEGAILSRDGLEYELALGENKPEPKSRTTNREAQAAASAALVQKLNLDLGSVPAAVAAVETLGIATPNAEGALIRLYDGLAARKESVWISDK